MGQDQPLSCGRWRVRSFCSSVDWSSVRTECWLIAGVPVAACRHWSRMTRCNWTWQGSSFSTLRAASDSPSSPIRAQVQEVYRRCMRTPFKRSDLAPRQDLCEVPSATRDSPVSVTFFGVATLLFKAGDSSIMTDGFFSRPGLRTVLGSALFRRMASEPGAITDGLSRLGVQELKAVLPLHTHFDHALDSAEVVKRTGGRLVGGASTERVGVGYGLSPDQIEVIRPPAETELGEFSVRHIASAHCPPNLLSGTIRSPVRPPNRLWAFKCGEPWSLLIQHGESRQRTVLVQGSAGFLEGALRDIRAEVAYLSVGALGWRGKEYIGRYWHETARAVEARRVVLIHWDDFFRPLGPGLQPMRYPLDNLDRTLRVLKGLAKKDEVQLHLPRLGSPEDPWLFGPAPHPPATNRPRTPPREN